MDIQRILKTVDHTLLSQTATWDQIRTLCDEAILYHTASVCIPPYYVARAREYCAGNMQVCTVIGFPNGYHTTAAKVFETSDAIHDGADEIDMVIPICALKDGRDGFILDEIKQIRQACGNRILKVIIEACLLTEDEKIRMCHIVTESGADFIKTSTGFSTGGATRADLLLFKQYIGQNVRIKAAGGIKSLEVAEDFLDLGVSRLGSSSIIKMALQQAEGGAPVKDSY